MKPCPFCGSQPEVKADEPYTVYIQCTNCSTHQMTFNAEFIEKRSQKQLISTAKRRWNRRHHN